MTCIPAPSRRVGWLLVLALLAPVPAVAQTIWLGASVVRDVQRFAEDVVPNRLDGAATGWTIAGGVRLLEHLVVAAEWSDAGTIADERTTTVTIGTRAVPITSTMRHRTRAAAALAGFGHSVGRASLAYLIGVARTTVRREFSTNAPALVLVSPSTPAVSAPPPVIDHVDGAVAGVDALTRITSAIALVAGVRFQRIALDPDVSGWSARSFVGAGWVF